MEGSGGGSYKGGPRKWEALLVHREMGNDFCRVPFRAFLLSPYLADFYFNPHHTHATSPTQNAGIRSPTTMQAAQRRRIQIRRYGGTIDDTEGPSTRPRAHPPDGGPIDETAGPTTRRGPIDETAGPMEDPMCMWRAQRRAEPPGSARLGFYYFFH